MASLALISALIAEDKYKELRSEIELDPSCSLLVDIGNETLLMRAAIYNSSACAEVLIQAGLDKNKKNISGKTALMIASDWSNFNIVQFLLQQGTEVSLRDGNGESAFDMAMERSLKSSRYRWIELFGLYNKQFDEKDLVKYHEMRLSVLFA